MTFVEFNIKLLLQFIFCSAGRVSVGIQAKPGFTVDKGIQSSESYPLVTRDDAFLDMPRYNTRLFCIAISVKIKYCSTNYSLL